MGGDFAPEATVLGAIEAQKQFSKQHTITLVGDSDIAKAIIEREGLIYNSSINLDEKMMMYILDLNKIEGENYPVIPHTDIFTWAVFMEHAQRKIFINSKTKIIEKCIFSKGLITISAHLNP